uniref:Uncharacterized protein n=1 Tax=Panagrolaimus sp. ES5 TaxID=591445 RepID=A0AC34GUR4_9BILA
MKSLRKFNFFRNNKHPKEDKENHDVSNHVRFDDHQDALIPQQPQRKSLKRRTSIDAFEKLDPYAARLAQPRNYRPVKSCIEGRQNNEYASSSDDDDGTLVSQRTSNRQKPKKRVTLQLQQKNMQIDYGMQTSSEYGSGSGPSPISEHLTFESHFKNEYSHGPDIWKRKYRQYKDLCREMKRENSKLLDRNRYYEAKLQFYDQVNEEVKTLRKQNFELHSQIQALNSQLRNYERHHYMPPPPSAYPMLQLPSHNTLFNQQHCGAGEKLVSNTQLPGFATSQQNSLFDEVDETRNFRTNESDRSSSDGPSNFSVLSSSTEEARGDLRLELSPPRHDRTLSLTILNDDGYSTTTNQSNQTLTTITTENANSTNMKTPPKVPLRRRVRFNSN